MRKIILFGGSFDPPGMHHIKICILLRKLYPAAKIVILPCGYRKDKCNRNIKIEHRIRLVGLAFSTLLMLGGIQIDDYDLVNDCFTATHELDAKYSKHGDVWHLVGTDIISGGAEKKSEIHRVWARKETDFCELQYLVSGRTGTKWATEDMPPKHEFVAMPFPGSSTVIRRLCAAGKESFKNYVNTSVGNYIAKNELYGWKK